jgi:predicted ATPase
MLHALELENFKAFGKRARIPFAPITLIFGENSAGKSTVLQALYLLKQTLERRDTGALLLPRTENGIVDLGSFQEMLFDHDLKRTLSIRVEPNLNWRIGIEFSFKRPSLEEEVLLDQISIYDGKSSKCLAKFQPLNTTEDPEEFWMRMGCSPPIPHDLSVPSKSSTVECVWLTADPEYWESEFEWCKENKVEIRKQFKSEKSRLEDQLLRRETNEGKDSVTETIRQLNAWDRKEIDFTSAALEFLSSDFDLKTYISKRCEDEMNTVLNLEGPLPDLCLSERDSFIERSRSLLYARYNGTKVFHIGEYVIDVGEELEQTLKALFPISPFRKQPERWYIFRGTSPQDVGYRGDLLPDLLLRRPELVDQTNEWLEKLNIGHKLTVKSMGVDSGDLFEVRLIDTRRRESVSVALPDVGFGVSQLLPFIVQSLVSEKQIISIEQPEVHVHPKLQADLGDLLAEAIQEPRQNQFIIETHSEHLILRLQRLVRKKEIKPEDVSVIYVSRGLEGAKVLRLHLDEDGDFIDDWPNGFFTERLREL